MPLLVLLLWLLFVFVFWLAFVLVLVLVFVAVLELLLVLFVVPPLVGGVVVAASLLSSGPVQSGSAGANMAGPVNKPL